MKTYNFYIDTKVTDWYRTEFEIEADSLKEAKLKAIEFVKEEQHTEIPWEQVDCTIEPMSVEENDNQSTEELYYESSDNLIWDNTKKDS
jgi:hypothetical protein